MRRRHVQLGLTVPVGALLLGSARASAAPVRRVSAPAAPATTQ